METPEAPVFFDPVGRRWRRVRRAWLACAIVFTVLAAIFIASVVINPWLPQLNLRPVSSLPKASDTNPQPPPLPTTLRDQSVRHAEGELRRALATTRIVPGKRPSQINIAPPMTGPRPASNLNPTASGKPLTIGFYVNWDDSSYSSLKRNLAHLDWVVPEWVHLQDGSDPLQRDIDPRALDLIRRERPDLPVLPLVQNFKNEQWDAALLARAVADEASRQRLIGALVSLVEQNKFGGVCIDLEEVPASSQKNLLTFVQELHDAFHQRGWIVAEAVPFDDSSWNYRAYADATDYMMLMGYDEHWAASDPGPIAAQDWFETTLAKRMRELDPAKTIVCVGNYGYNWDSKEKQATEMTFQEAALAARDSEARIRFDPVSRNPSFGYEEEDGSRHTVWFLDAVATYNQIRAANSYHLAGFALWRLGSEDPSLWSFFGATPAVGQTAQDNRNTQSENNSASVPSPDGLHDISYGYDIDIEGSGEILQVESLPQDGTRNIKVDPASGQIVSEDYTRIPSSYVIRRYGDHPGLIALTFDDGPDAVWTPRILDILKQENVPATFFIIGEDGQAHPDLVRRIVAEGHDIGNHTYTHPNLGEIPVRITDLELNATQRLIESLTGRSTKLFRPPFFGDAEPTTPDEVEPTARADKLGYLTIGLHIDPDDWALPGSDAIVQKTIAGALNTDPDKHGQVVLLHDGGGNRAQTVEALPRIIHELRARGFRFVTVSQLAGLTRDQAMPPVKREQGVFAGANAVTFYTLSTGSWLLHWIFLVGIVLGVARVGFIGILALAQWWRARRRAVTHAGETYEPFVSIIVPAYNEERVITTTIQSLLYSDYERYEIIVVDDGSSDQTSAIVREFFAKEPRVRLFTRENLGKAAALNFGLRQAQGVIIVALDADTIFAPQTIAALAHRFSDPQIGAVAGNAKVGNRINLVTRWQALEYITSQNLDRRAFASLNCITVVPGAVGAWRRDLLDQAGGFDSDTLAEDQDLTLRVRRLGYKIGYSERAVAWTEAPDTLRTLAKQRFRWAFGTLQCMWKHSDALFRPRYGALGFIAMPNVWIFQIIFPLISPVMDLMLIWTIVSAGLSRIEHGGQYVTSNLQQVLFYYALFLAVDWFAAAFAFLLEKREQWNLLWWLFLQRFCYRQVMYYVMIKSVANAARGALVGWGKLERKATVQVQQ